MELLGVQTSGDGAPQNSCRILNPTISFQYAMLQGTVKLVYTFLLKLAQNIFQIYKRKNTGKC